MIEQGTAQAKLTDKLSKPIGIGDTIAYPGRSGSSCWLRVAKVIGLQARDDFHQHRRYPRLRVEHEMTRVKWFPDTITGEYKNTPVTRTVRVWIRCVSQVVVVEKAFAYQLDERLK